MKKTSLSCLQTVTAAIFNKLEAPETLGECNGPRQVRHYLLRKDYLRKFNDKKANPDRTAATRAIWEASEKRCYMANRRIGNCSDFDRLGVFLAAIRAVITDCIGHSVPKGLFNRNCRFTSGASYKTPRGVHYSEKMNELTVTAEASLFLDAFSGICHNLTVVPGNRMCAVPKTVKVDRLISIEPSGNAFLQQSVGRFFKSCLLRKGIDLFDQTANQDGAFRAVVDGLATIDLESASDSVCTELVRAVLPHEWFTLLNQLRSHKTEWDGKWRYLDKFSSMGNGFTFELESLIFWAVAKVICPSFDPLIYGDDIIVPQSHAVAVINGLEWLGFVVNKEKTFITGSYFESCGKHYFDLDEVTSIFQKEDILCLPSAMRAHNRLVRWALRYDDFTVVRAATKLIRAKFKHDHCLIPFGVERDDGWLVHPSAITRNVNGDFVTNVIKILPKTNNKVFQDNCLAYKLYNFAQLNEDPRGYPLNCIGDLSKYVVRRCLIWASSLNT